MKAILSGRILKYVLLVTLTVVLTFWLIRAMNSRSLPDTFPWHKPVLSSEFRASEYPDGIDFDAYQKLEEQLDRELRTFVSNELAGSQSRQALRYFGGSPLNPLEYPVNWNWSYIIEHDSPRGAAVLIHGASDSPYSMRTLATRLHEEGLQIIAVRLPGHGTLPGELLKARTADWRAVTRSAVAKARDVVGPDKPVYIGGYSMGGALAVDYALDAIVDPELVLPSGLLLVSPAIAIHPLVALATIDLVVSRIPGFQKFAWTDINPEYDPYKYNSFPKQAGRQTYLLTTFNQKRVDQLSQTDAWNNFPPVITFMSAVDATVRLSAVVDNLYQSLPSNGSALVVFGVNRTNEAMGFLKEGYLDDVSLIQSVSERHYDLTVVSNQSETRQEVSAFTYCAHGGCEDAIPLDLAWPPSVFSLSHVALPFSEADPIYGARPGPESPGDFTLGSLQPRGERGVLLIPTEQLMRLRYNPFLPYMLDRAGEFCR